MELKKELVLLSKHLDSLLILDAVSDASAPRPLVERGLVDKNGLSRKGKRLLEYLMGIADLLDVNYG